MAVARTLPVVHHKFDSLTNVTANATGGGANNATLSLDANESGETPWCGASSVLVDSPSVNSGQGFNVVVDFGAGNEIDMSHGDCVGFVVEHLKDGPHEAWSVGGDTRPVNSTYSKKIRIGAGEDGYLLNNFIYQDNLLNFTPTAGITLVCVNKDILTQEAGPNGWNPSGPGVDWSNIQSLVLGVGQGEAGTNAQQFKVHSAFTYDSTDTTPKLPICITFDDGNEEQATIIEPILTARNLVATAYIHPALIGTAGYLTWAQVQQLYAAGWSIANHGDNQLDVDVVGTAAWLQNFDDGRNAIVAQGVANPVQTTAYPFGETETALVEGMVARNVMFARTTGKGHPFYEQYFHESVFGDMSPAQRLFVRSMPLSHTDGTFGDAAGHIAGIDASTALGQGYVMAGHKVVAVPASDTAFATTEFETLADYIEGLVIAGTHEVVTDARPDGPNLLEYLGLSAGSLDHIPGNWNDAALTKVSPANLVTANGNRQ